MPQNTQSISALLRTEVYIDLWTSNQENYTNLLSQTMTKS